MDYMRKILTAALFALSLFAVAPAHQAHAKPAIESREPLVVIRFNQRSVYYDRQLYTAMSKALEVKPGVMFDVVALSPANGDARSAKERAGQVISSMNKIGMPLERITLKTADDNSIGWQEVRIYVR